MGLHTFIGQYPVNSTRKCKFPLCRCRTGQWRGAYQY